MKIRQMGRGPLGFLTGVFSTQLANSALHLAQPLLIAEITGSIGLAAFFSSFDTAVHMLGTFLGGWPVNLFGARRVVITATAARGICLGAVPLAMWFWHPSVYWVMAWYTADALVRGFVDAAAYTLPLELAEHKSLELDNLNSRFEVVFDIGGIIGPLILSGLLFWFAPKVAHALIPIGFLISAMAYMILPKPSKKLKLEEKQFKVSGGTLAGFRTILGNRNLLVICAAYMLFNIYPLRKLLGAFFAKAILMKAPLAGTVGAAFGFGGLVGALIYAQGTRFRNDKFWLITGAFGMIVLGFGWLPHNLYVMCAAVFAFAVTNVGARLTLTKKRQQLTPLENAGGVTAASRFGANLVSVSLKAMVGAAFTIVASASQAFLLVGVSLALIAGAQYLLSREIVSARAA